MAGPLAPNTAVCGNCAFWLHKPPDDSVCRCHPPTVTSAGTTVWPQVNADDWCGEYRMMTAGPAAARIEPGEITYVMKRGELMRPKY